MKNDNVLDKSESFQELWGLMGMLFADTGRLGAAAADIIRRRMEAAMAMETISREQYAKLSSELDELYRLCQQAEKSCGYGHILSPEEMSQILSNAEKPHERGAG